MTTLAQPTKTGHFHFWQPMLYYGLPLFLVYGLAFFLEPYSGGCGFILPIYFYTLLTVMGVLKYQRFGTGLLIYLPFAVLGVPMDYYGDWVYSQNLIDPWYSLGWAPVFLGFGLVADLAYRFLPAGWNPRWRAVAMGVIFGLAFYLLVLFALTTFYPVSDERWHLWYFQGGVYFSLPWMLVNGGFAGYTAHAISQRA